MNIFKITVAVTVVVIMAFLFYPRGHSTKPTMREVNPCPLLLAMVREEGLPPSGEFWFWSLWDELPQKTVVERPQIKGIRVVCISDNVAITKAILQKQITYKPLDDYCDHTGMAFDERGKFLVAYRW